MHRTLLSIVAVSFLAAACGSSGASGPEGQTGGGQTETGDTDPGAGEPDPDTGDTLAGGSCEARTDCAECVAAAGCNWTGGTCASACLMDTYCIGPGNPSAPTCGPGVLILGGWQEDHSAREGETMAFVRDDVELGPARFRRTLTFHDSTEEGPATVQTNVLAANDAHTTAQGTWGIQGQTLTLTYRLDGASEDTVERFEIVDVDASTLRLRAVAE